MNFIGIVGTNASFSYNRKLLWYMKRRFKDQATIEIQEIADIPLFSEDIEVVPTRVREIAHAIEEADGVIFSTPEYDHSITAGLKSLIEWLSWGDLHPLTNTPVMIVGVSLGNMGTVFAQENLRQILSSPGLDAFVLPSNQFLLGRAAASFDENDQLTDERTAGWLEHCFANFQQYAETLAPMRHSGTDRTSALMGMGGAKKPKIVEEGDGWWIEAINLGFPIAESDTDTGASKKEENFDTDTGASAKEEEPLRPTPGAEILESGDGWWIEAVTLLDASTGASKAESAPATGASRHGAVADAKGQPDSSTGASKH